MAHGHWIRTSQFPTRQLCDPCDEEMPEIEKQTMARLREHMKVHHCPVMVLGSGRASLADKFQTVLYSLLLEAGARPAGFPVYLSCVRTLTSDLGVEFGISRIAPVKFGELWPWYSLDPAGGGAGHGGDGDGDAVGVGVVADDEDFQVPADIVAEQVEFGYAAMVSLGGSPWGLRSGRLWPKEFLGPSPWPNEGLSARPDLR